ncbi:MAG: hypothetical protein AAB359_00170 [Elusimicrobiota bacterium]
MIKIVMLVLALPLPGLARDMCGGPAADSFVGGFTIGFTKELSDEAKYGILRINSRARAEQLKLILLPLSEGELRLAAKMGEFKPHLVSRAPFEKLRSVLKAGQLLSPRELERRGMRAARPYTPEMEDILFGGYSCVFAALGPYQGRERYGDVVFRFDPEKIKKKAWATFSSGYYYMIAVRKIRLEAGYKPAPDDIRGFADTVFTGDDWDEVYPLMVVAHLRNKPDSGKLLDKLLAASDAVKFYDLVEKHKVGYMEAKILDYVDLTDAERIEAPKDKLKEALAWPEAAPYREKLHPY